MTGVRPLPWRSWTQRQRALRGQSLGWELPKPLPLAVCPCHHPLMPFTQLAAAELLSGSHCHPF